MTGFTNFIDEVIDADVLVIGSGTAGFMAAVNASELAENIVLVTKEREVGAGSASILATDPYSSCVVDSKSALDFGFPGNENDCPEVFFNDIVREGRDLAQRRLVKAFVDEIPTVIEYLTSLGYEWDYSRLDRSKGHAFARDLYGRRSPYGLEFALVLRKTLREREKIKVYTDIVIIDLLVNEGRIVGATGLDLKTGFFLVFRAKSTVLASGGAHNIYPRASVGTFLTGDGQAMALRAGAELVNNEFVTFALNVIWPPDLAHRKGALLQLLYRDGTSGCGQLLNAQGEPFMEKENKTTIGPQNSAKLHPKVVTRVRVMKEILEGRGSEHGGVYFSIRNLSQEQLDQLSTLTKFNNWVDPSTRFDFGPYIEQMKAKTFVEVGIACHYFLGGISIDTDCRTNLPGLFAAGECTGNFHGASRLGGMALSQALFEGARAGKSAGMAAKKSINLQEIKVEQVEDSRNYVRGLLERQEGINPISLRSKIQVLAMEKVGVIRNDLLLKQAINEIEHIKKFEMPRVHVTTKKQVYNFEWLEAIQLRNLLLNLEIVAKAALLRKESRGTHYRSDFPMEDDDSWKFNIVARQAGGEEGMLELLKRAPILLDNQVGGT